MSEPDARLDRAFHALSDPTRRALIARLSRGPATVGALAEPFPYTQQAISRHLQVLESAGLVTRSRKGQQRPCHLAVGALEELTGWLDRYRREAEEQYRRLDAVLAETDASPRQSPSTPDEEGKGRR
ncbi:ArsR/SmtB family transcription factor [Gryllotalpicola ginsengisoli]|uniref:ArsR/SmtB family transcription factor n=1 Tax=Gryllotalpicola ginsengisoli TaxID=444608 RepID=UPI00047FDFA2|nr:metalloregulator ArsR/SmtB family transcription factor [Gryllotalpicola ginsengisoli]